MIGRVRILVEGGSLIDLERFVVSGDLLFAQRMLEERDEVGTYVVVIRDFTSLLGVLVRADVCRAGCVVVLSQRHVGVEGFGKEEGVVDIVIKVAIHAVMFLHVHETHACAGFVEGVVRVIVIGNHV